jgi:hypothetical protein
MVEVTVTWVSLPTVIKPIVNGTCEDIGETKCKDSILGSGLSDASKEEQITSILSRDLCMTDENSVIARNWTIHHAINFTAFERRHNSCISPAEADHGNIIGTNAFLGISSRLSCGWAISAGIEYIMVSLFTADRKDGNEFSIREHVKVFPGFF